MLEIGLEVKILRERLKLSAKELAGRIGLSQSQMSRLEKGQRRIDTRILARIAEALEVDPAHFFHGELYGEGDQRQIIPPSDPGDLGKHIRSERRRRHISAEELARRLGVTKAKVLSIEEGKRELDPDLAERVTKVLRLSANYFLRLQQERIRRLESQLTRLDQALAEQNRGDLFVGGERQAERRAVPVLGTLAGGYPEAFDSVGEPTAEVEDFVYLPGEESGAFAVHVVGDSMQAMAPPSFREGDLAVFARGSLRSRDLAFVRLREEAPTFRQVFFDPASQVRLQPLNLNYPSRAYSRDELLGMWRLAAHVARF